MFGENRGKSLRKLLVAFLSPVTYMNYLGGEGEASIGLSTLSLNLFGLRRKVVRSRGMDTSLDGRYVSDECKLFHSSHYTIFLARSNVMIDSFQT